MNESVKVFGRLLAVLKAEGIIDDLEIKYISGIITKEEFEEKYNELYSKDKLFKTIFMPFDPTGGKSNESN